MNIEFSCNIPYNSNLMIYKDCEAHRKKKKQENIFAMIFKIYVHSRPQVV